jgi:hypothetical protein
MRPCPRARLGASAHFVKIRAVGFQECDEVIHLIPEKTVHERVRLQAGARSIPRARTGRRPDGLP